MTPEIKKRIEDLIDQNPVMLFIKGTKAQPQCGFSRSVVDVLGQVAGDFTTFDVLSDPEMREGIKTFSSWPTIPQLYINKEFIGGCDIVMDLFHKNELQEMLGMKRAFEAPAITLTGSALSALRNAAFENDTPGPIRLTVGADYGHGLAFDEKNESDFVVAFEGVELIVDPYSALRAERLTIDYVEEKLDAGFSFDNPNAPPEVADLNAAELDEWRRQNKEHLLIDVRPKSEWEVAHIKGAQLIEDIGPTALEALDKNQTIVLHCHHGGRSRRMAETLKARGFRNLYNLKGGIDAWAKEVDRSVPLY